MATRSKSVPSVEVVDTAAAALGEDSSATEKRGAKVQVVLHDLFETNPHPNRAKLSVICARLRLATLTIETLERGETDLYLEENPNARAAVNVRLDELDAASRTMRRNCNKASTLAGVKA